MTDTRAERARETLDDEADNVARGCVAGLGWLFLSVGVGLLTHTAYGIIMFGAVLLIDVMVSGND